MENITELHIKNEINGKTILKEVLEEDGILNLEISENETMWNIFLIVGAYIGMGLLLLFKLLESFKNYLMG